MTRQPLRTTRRRLALAVLFGVLVPPVLTCVEMIAWAIPTDPMWRMRFDPEIVLNLLLWGSGFSALLFALFAMPIWWLLYIRSASLRLVILCGAGLGMAVPLAVIAIVGATQPLSVLWIAIQKDGILLAGGVIIGAITALGVWKIAYPPPPTPQAVAETFA